MKSYSANHKRTQCIKEVLVEKFYLPLIEIIIAYDYRFNGELYKTLDNMNVVNSICELADNKLISCCRGNNLLIWDVDENNYQTITHKHDGIWMAVVDSNGYIITVPFGPGTID